MRPDAMQDYRTPPDAVDEQEIGSEMALSEAIPGLASPAEAVLAQGRGQPLAQDQGVEDILECFGVEFDVLTSVSIVALEAREDD